MSDRGFDLANEFGALDSTTLQNHTIISAFFSDPIDRGFTLKVSPILTADTATAFRAIRIYDGTYPGNGDLLKRFEVADASISELGTVTIDAVDYPNTVQYFWTLAEDEANPLAGITTFSVVLERFTTEETGEEFQGIIQFPYLDLGTFGSNKMMDSFDLVADAPLGLDVSFGYDQRNIALRTTPYTMPADTLPGTAVPMPITGPSFDMKITFAPGQQWEFEAACLYVMDTK